MTLNKRLRDQRLLVGLSQSNVAEKLNISRQAISQWENGKSYPDIDNLNRLSEIYHISLDDLISGNNNIEEANSVKTPISNETNKNNTSFEIDFVLLTISCVLFVIAPLGLFISPIVIWQAKRAKSLRNIIYIISIIAVIYNLYVGYATIMNYMNVGNSSYR